MLREHPALDEVDRRRHAGLAAGPQRRPLVGAALRDDARAATTAGRARASTSRSTLQGLIKSGVLVAATRRARARRLRGGPSSASRSNALFTNRRGSRRRATASHVVDQYLALLDAARHQRAAARVPPAVGAGRRGGVDEWLAAAGIKPRHRLVVLNPGAGPRRQAVAGGALRDAGPAPRPRRRRPRGDHVGTGRGGSRPRHRERRAGVGPRRGAGAAHGPRHAAGAAAPRQRARGRGHGAAAPGRRARHAVRRTLRPDVRRRNGPYGAGHRTLSSDGRDDGLAGSRPRCCRSCWSCSG